MITENLSTLKINRLTQAQYDREFAAGRLDANALYLTPDESQVTDSNIYVQADEPPGATDGALWLDTDEEPESGGTVSPEAIKQAVDEYMVENPPVVSGSGGIVKVYEITTTEDVSRIVITKDSDGNTFSYKMMWVFVYTPKVATEVSGARAMLSIGSNENSSMNWSISASRQNFSQACGYPSGMTECFVNGDYQAANHAREYHTNIVPYTKVVLRANTFAVADARIPAGTIVQVFGLN